MVARELTKVHEQLAWGTAASIGADVPEPRGEFTIVVSPAVKAESVPHEASDTVIWTEFGAMTESGAVSRRAAVAALAKKYGVSSRNIYSTIEKIKASVE